MDRGLTEPGRERAPLDHRLTQPGDSFGCFNGHGRLVIMSADEHERLKYHDRQALAVEELSDAELDAIRRAEPPAGAARYDHELSVGYGVDT